VNSFCTDPKLNLLPILAIVNLVAQAPAPQPALARVPTLQRLEKSYLERLHADVLALAKLPRTSATPAGLHDWRCIIHCHCYQSHDSRGTIEDISTAAKSVGIDCIFMSDHPRDTYDVVAKGPHGEFNGVLFVPGSETDGFTLYPGDYKLPKLGVGEQNICDEIKQSNGMLFIAHPEEHSDWNLKNLTGMEIYNTHADFRDETALLAALQPKKSSEYGRMLGILNNMNDFPREAIASITDPQPDNLKHYDYMCKTRVLAAVAGNDSHQNVGFVVKGTKDGRYLLEDALGEKLSVLDGEKTPIIKLLFGPSTPGKVLYKRQLDPYAVSLGYVNTHVLASERTETTLRKALANAKTYVAFDWIADPRGMAFTLETPGSGDTVTLGDTVPFTAGSRFRLHTPIAAHTRLMRDGKEIATTDGDTLEASVPGTGVYRMESYLTVGGETRTWILTAAIKVQ
jgi:hypothetical protein